MINDFEQMFISHPRFLFESIMNFKLKKEDFHRIFMSPLSELKSNQIILYVLPNKRHRQLIHESAETFFPQLGRISLNLSIFSTETYRYKWKACCFCSFKGISVRSDIKVNEEVCTFHCPRCREEIDVGVVDNELDVMKIPENNVILLGEGVKKYQQPFVATSFNARSRTLFHLDYSLFPQMSQEKYILVEPKQRGIKTLKKSLQSQILFQHLLLLKTNLNEDIIKFIVLFIF